MSYFIDKEDASVAGKSVKIIFQTAVNNNCGRKLFEMDSWYSENSVKFDSRSPLYFAFPCFHLLFTSLPPFYLVAEGFLFFLTMIFHPSELRKSPCEYMFEQRKIPFGVKTVSMATPKEKRTNMNFFAVEAALSTSET